MSVCGGHARLPWIIFCATDNHFGQYRAIRVVPRISQAGEPVPIPCDYLSARLIVSLILASLGFAWLFVLPGGSRETSTAQRTGERAEVLGESLADNVERSWEVGSDREFAGLVHALQQSRAPGGSCRLRQAAKAAGDYPRDSLMALASPPQRFHRLSQRSKSERVRPARSPTNTYSRLASSPQRCGCRPGWQ